MYKYLLFDADNTLLDFNKGERCALNKVLADSPLDFSDEVYEVYHKINDDLWKKLEKGEIERSKLRVVRFEQLFDVYGFDGKEYGEIIDSRFLAAMSEQAYIIDGVYDVLDHLCSKYKLYLITNASVSVQKKRIAKTSFDKYFNKYYISEEIGAYKPQIEFFDAVINDIGDFNRKNYLVIGDSLSSDIKGAVSSGLDCCFYNPTNMSVTDIKPTYDINDICELLEIL